MQVSYRIDDSLNCSPTVWDMGLFLHPRWFPLKLKFSNLRELQFVDVSLYTCFLV